MSMIALSSSRRRSPVLDLVLAPWLVPTLLLIGMAGYFGPWVPHRAAGLVVIGLDLAEYVKFLPEFIARRVVFPREIFYLPLLAGSLSASLLAGRSALPRPLRLALLVAAVPLALAMLPPAWKPADLKSPEYALQAAAIALCLLVVPGVVATRRLPDRAVFALIAALALLAAVWPAWGFLQIHPAIEAVYRRALPFGWGFWACLLGYLLAAAVSLFCALRGE
jgi:hypothetical protein